MKNTNVHVMRPPEGKDRAGGKKLKKVMAQKFPDLLKYYNLHI